MVTTEGGRRWWPAVVAAVALLAVGVVIGLVLGGGSDDDVATSGSSTTTTAFDDAPPRPTEADGSDATTTTAGQGQGPIAPTPQGRELIDLIARGQSLTYTATYQNNDPTSQLGTLSVQVYRDGSHVRQDATVQVESRTIESEAFTSGGTVRACQRAVGDATWQCRDVPADQAPDVDGRIRQAVTQLSGQTTGGVDTTIAGQPSRCYDVTDEDGSPMELCVTNQGVPARLVSGAARVELVAWSAGVPDGIFTPPA